MSQTVSPQWQKIKHILQKKTDKNKILNLNIRLQYLLSDSATPLEWVHFGVTDRSEPWVSGQYWSHSPQRHHRRHYYEVKNKNKAFMRKLYTLLLYNSVINVNGALAQRHYKIGLLHLYLQT